MTSKSKKDKKDSAVLADINSEPTSDDTNDQSGGQQGGSELAKLNEDQKKK